MRLGSKFGQFRINNKQIVRNKIEIRADWNEIKEVKIN